MENVLVLIDIQKEYTTKGRPFVIESIASSLENCRKCLDYARKNRWSIAHVRHLQEGEIFNASNPYSEYVDGFNALHGEAEFVKSNFSCFSSEDFCSFMGQRKNDRIYIVGYGSTMCCISTIIDGFHKGFNLTYIHDASAAKKGLFDESSTHAHATEIISTFARVMNTGELIGHR